MKGKSTVRFLALAGVIAAMYTALTYAAAAVNLAYGEVQFRFSEALTVLPVFTPAAIPGLTIGCFLSNIASPMGVVDWVFGSQATLLAALWTYAARKVEIKGVPWLAPLPPVICNAVIIGLEIACISDGGAFGFANFSWVAFGGAALSVGLGELVVCCALGIPLILALKKVRLEEKLQSARI